MYTLSSKSEKVDRYPCICWQKHPAVHHQIITIMNMRKSRSISMFTKMLRNIWTTLDKEKAMSHYYTVIQPKSGLFPYCTIKVLSDNRKSLEHGNTYCLKTKCLKCGRTYFPCCEPADCEIFKAENTVFSDAEMEEISRIIRDYKERKKWQNHL